MTEAEWLACADPSSMLDFLRGRLSERKLRLFGCACCRAIWRLTPDDRSRRAVEVAERHADGLATAAEVEDAGADAAEVDADVSDEVQPDVAWRAATAAAHLLPEAGETWQVRDVWTYVATALEGQQLVEDGATAEMLESWSDQSVESGRTMGWTDTDPGVMVAGLLREVVGPLPFRPIPIESTWRTPAVLSLAQDIYADRAFDRLPILADALRAPVSRTPTSWTIAGAKARTSGVAG